jgi:hypothetical protein
MNVNAHLASDEKARMGNEFHGLMGVQFRDAGVGRESRCVMIDGSPFGSSSPGLFMQLRGHLIRRLAALAAEGLDLAAILFRE